MKEISEEDRSVRRLTTRIFDIGSLVLVASSLITSYCTGKERELAKSMVEKYRSMEETPSKD
ncbi:MAG: hypothetical protein OXG24_01300 [Gammaproteobacteria bacterium]|nr:hypothetical protein [Gammaproteobacteria bacterium]